MSKKAKFVIDTQAFSREVMRADFMAKLVRDTTIEIAVNATNIGKGSYVPSRTIGRKRALGMVRADDFEARKDDYDNNTLLKAAYPLQVVEK